MNHDRTYLGRIKDSVDFIHALVTESQDGYTGGFDKFGSALIPRVSCALVKRGVLIRSAVKRDDGKTGRLYQYKWSSNMSPTNTLYKTVMSDIRESKAEENMRGRQRRAEKQTGMTPTAVIMEEHAAIPESVVETVINAKKEFVTDLDGFSAQELWDELKKRGYTIEDNRLVIVKKAYLD